MKFSTVPSTLYLCLLLPSGCGGGAFLEEPPPPRELGREYTAFRAPDRSGVVKEPRGDLTLAGALALALQGNPELRAFSWEVRAAEARRLQEGLLPNPEISLEVEEFGGTRERSGLGGAQTTLTLSQLVQLGGKRPKRERAAAARAALAGWDYERKRLDVYFETARAFYGVLEAQERLALAEETLEVARRLRALSQERVKAGKVSPLEETKAALQAAVSRVALERARRDLDAARRRLSSSWGSPSARFSRAVGDFRALPPGVPSLEELQARLEKNPDLARWRDEMEFRKASLEAARAGRWPDLTLGGGVQWYDGGGERAFVLQASLPLVIFDRNQGKILEEERLLSKAASRRRSALVRSRAALASSHRAALESLESARLFRREILPAAERAFQTARRGYAQGKLDYLQVLDAQRTLLRVRSDYLDTLSSCRLAILKIERLTAAPLRPSSPGKKEQDR